MIKLRTIITSLAFASLCPLSISAQKLQVGSYTFKDGSIYTGDMTNNKPNGKGRTQFRNGDVYEGFYLKGKRNGDGLLIFADGEKYQGSWFNDQQHGLTLIHN